MCTLSVSNVIYHKFSHGATFYTLNGKNVNVMLEFCLTLMHSEQPKLDRDLAILSAIGSNDIKTVGMPRHF